MRRLAAVLVVLVSTTGCGSTAQVVATPNVEGTVTARVQATQTAMPRPPATPVLVATPITATPTTVAPPKPTAPPATPTLVPNAPGSRSNPIAAGSTVRITTSGGRAFDVTVLDFKRGADAVALARQMNSFNGPLKDENIELLLVKLRVKYVDGPSDSVFGVTDSKFVTTGADAILHNELLFVSLSPSLQANLFPGGTAEGWGAYVITTGDPSPILGSKLGGESVPTTWFALE